MKKSISLITLTLLFGFFCTTLTWAGHGQGMRDGSMQNVDQTDTITISGVVSSSGTAGSGLTVDEGEGVLTTVYGMGPLSFWEAISVAKPSVGETVAIDAVEVTFSDNSTRLIALSLTVNDTTVTLRDADGRPLWRGGEQKRNCGAATDAECRGQGNCLNNNACPMTTR